MACLTDKKKPGRWSIDFYDREGKRRLKVLPKGTTKTEAKRVLREIEGQLDRGTYIPTDKVLTFAEVAKEWIEFKKTRLRASTWSVYEGHTRNHFSDLDHLKINRITIATIEKFITARQNEGMHILTLRKILVSVGQIMAFAVRHRLIDHNPVRDAERPRSQGQVEKPKIRVLNPDEIRRFLDAVEDQKYKALFQLAIFSGSRQGELFGLKWTDVDWFNGQIHVQRTFNNQAWYKPKSAASDRKIDLGPAMMAELKEWFKVCPEADMGLIFPNGAGQPMNHNNMVNRHFDPAVRKAGLGKVRFHDLRHTFASLLIEQGENIKYIQSQLGHSSPSVTLNVYTHLLKPTNQKAAKRLEETILVNGDQMETRTKKGPTSFTVSP